MIIRSFAHLDPWTMALSLALHLAFGLLIGLIYFQAVWWSARQFASGGRVATTIALSAGRFVLLVGFLTLASLEGARPLLAMTLGVLIARPMMMRRLREASP